MMTAISTCLLAPQFGFTAEESPAKPAQPAVKPTLTSIQLGTLSRYSRLAFSFSQPVGKFTVKRTEVDQIELDFGTSIPEKQGKVGLSDHLVQGAVVYLEEGRLKVRVKLTKKRFRFRHFLTQQDRMVVLDIRPAPQMAETAPGKAPEEGLTFPDLKTVAKSILPTLPADPPPNTADALLVQGVKSIALGDYRGAVATLESLRTTYPDPPQLDPALFLLGEAYYEMDPNNVQAQLLYIRNHLENAVSRFPSSPLAPRAMLVLANAYDKSDYITETVNTLKQLIQDYSEDPYALIGRVRLGDMYLKLGKRQLARAAYESVIAMGADGDLVLSSYAKLGESFFQEGLFSQANEVFREIIDHDEWFYLQYPDILYFLGEGYYHLGRPELARAFLYHALNVSPEHEASDMMMARIGDTYRAENMNQEAMKMYSLTRQRYPGTTGAVISQMRLADYGSLRGIFQPGNVFIQLEDGSESATLQMYKEVVESKKDSPLVQLAMFKIGLAYMGQGEYGKAIDVLADLLSQYPKGSLTSDVQDVMAQAVLKRIENLYYEKKYVELMALFGQYEKLLEGEQEAMGDIRHFMAQAGLAMKMPAKAVQYWEQNTKDEKNKAERLLGLGRAYMELSRYEDAIRSMEAYRADFPNTVEAVQTLVEQAKAEVALKRDDKALALLEEAVKTDPILDKNSSIQGMLGRLYMEKGELEKGVQAMQKALAGITDKEAAREEIFLTYSRLGQAYTSLKRNEDAENALDKALTFQPQQPMPETLYLIAGSYKNLGLTDKYRQTLELMQKINDPFWRDVATQELKSMTPDPEVKRILSGQSEENQETLDAAATGNTPGRLRPNK
jgi:TolA-binding protein